VTRRDGVWRPDFDIDYRYGRQGELLVADVLRQIANGDARVEVKTSRFSDWFLFVEVQQRPRGCDWRPSGIAATSAEYWAFVKPNGCILLAPTEELRKHVATSQLVGGGENGDNPTKGVLVNAALLLKGKKQ
jgi:hypothetical protein